MGKPHVAIFPLSGGMGHFLPLAEFAKRLCDLHGFSITLILSRWMWTSQQSALLQRLQTSSALDIHFTEIPHITESEEEQEMRFESRMSNFMVKAKPHIEEVLQLSRSSPSPVSAFITDLFCTELLDITTKLKIPCYVFVPASAASVCFMLNLPKLVSEIAGVSYKDADFELEVPGLPPIPARDLPTPVQEKSESWFQWFLNHVSRFKKASGIFINTFAELEEEAMRTLSTSATPPIYPIGPLFLTQSDSPDETRCLQWLDEQPPSSVLFVSFGSAGILSRRQITDLAIGLEASGHRFLWVLRSGDSSSPETDISQLLPEGFESRTRDRGMVVLNWAPQIPILSHPSTGGFLSHCGWNSTLESVCHGVPTIAWPLFAEQGINKVILVKQIEVAISLKMDKEGFVRKEEVERAVRELMEGEGGRKAREKMKEMKEKAKIAMMEGGSTMMATARAAADLAVSTSNAN